MRITESKLRSVIKKVITEMNNDEDIYRKFSEEEVSEPSGLYSSNNPSPYADIEGLSDPLDFEEMRRQVRNRENRRR
tara:strand:- start:342 stop:572 length:231 start_codon:yes stop_codon:yes gene_type:complete